MTARWRSIQIWQRLGLAAAIFFGRSNVSMMLLRPLTRLFHWTQVSRRRGSGAVPLPSNCRGSTKPSLLVDAGKPDIADAGSATGNVLRAIRRYDGRLCRVRQSRPLNPDLAEAWLGQGNVDAQAALLDEALAAYDRVLTLKSDHADAWIGRGAVFTGFKRMDDALAALDRALELKPNSAEGWFGRGRVLFEINRVAEAIAAYDKALLIKPDFADVISNRMFALDFLTESDFAEQQEARSLWWQKVGSPIAERSQASHRNALIPDRRLKVGYVSPDFRRHSAARCFRPMLRCHDKASFEIVCYSSSTVEDDLTEEFQQLADRWRNVAQLSDDELCKLIQDDQIDILVDLAGHTAGNRLPVFARKPAPVQVSAGATGTRNSEDPQTILSFVTRWRVRLRSGICLPRRFTICRRS